MHRPFVNETTRFGISFAQTLRERNLPEGWRVDWRGEPTRYKSYTGGRRIALDPHAPLRFSGTSHNILASYECDTALATRLGHCLLLCGGLSHSRVGMPAATEDRAVQNAGDVAADLGDEILPSYYPVRRPTPSGGALYPYESYLQWPGSPELARGVYHYDAFAHALDWIADLGEAGSDSMVLTITAAFWKNEFKYGNSAVCLCLLDAGALIGQFMQLAPGFGFPGSVQLDFVDDAVDRLLRLDSRYESPVAVINAPLATKCKSGAQCEDGVGNTSSCEISPAPTCSLVSEFFLASRLKAGDTKPTASAASYASASASPILLPPTTGPHAINADFGLHLRQRASGIHPHRQEPLSLLALAELCREQFANPEWLCSPHLQPGDLLEARVVALNVTGLPCGVYRYCHRTDTLNCVYEREPESLACALQESYNLKNIGFGVASAVFFLTSRYRDVIGMFGNRGYRYVNIVAGIMVQRCYALTATLHLGCHAILGFNDLAAEKMLALVPKHEHLVIGMAVGAKPESQPFLRMPLWI